MHGRMLAVKDTGVEDTLVHRRVASARVGANPTVICRMRSGWLVLGDRQVLSGYSVLLPDPVVPHLNSLDPDSRSRFLLDMSIAGDALLKVTESIRVNYAILGNYEPALHAHIYPRYAWEPEDKLTGSPLAYEWAEAREFDAALDRQLMEETASAIRAMGGDM